MVLGGALDESDAFVAAWLPGTEGEGVRGCFVWRRQAHGQAAPQQWPRDNNSLSSLTATEIPCLRLVYGLTF